MYKLCASCLTYPDEESDNEEAFPDFLEPESDDADHPDYIDDEDVESEI